MITSTANTQVKEVQKLQKSSRFRNERGLFVVEGWRMLREMPEDHIETIYVTEESVAKIQEMNGDQTPVLVSAKVMKAMSNEVTPQGVLGVVRMAQVEKGEQAVDNPLILALDCVQDPGNLGTIIRTAEAAGVDMLVLSQGTVDLYNPKVVKATMGAIFRLPIIRDVKLLSYIEEIKSRGISVYAAHLKGDAMHYDLDCTGGTCFLMGNEGNGLRDEIADAASSYLRIPMEGKAESLNVAMAAGLLVYEAHRQRHSL